MGHRLGLSTSLSHVAGTVLSTTPVSLGVDAAAACEDLHVAPDVAAVRRDEADGAVQMLLCSVDDVLHPGHRVIEARLRSGAMNRRTDVACSDTKALGTDRLTRCEGS